MKILFVCTGNTCRSCMAEAIFNNMCKIDDITAVSAGVYVVKDSKTSKNTINVVKKHIKVDLSDRKACQLSLDLLKEVDLVLTMTNSIKDLLQSQFSNIRDKIYSLPQYVGMNGDVVDPYGADESIYSSTYVQLNNLIALLIDKLKKDNSIS